MSNINKVYYLILLITSFSACTIQRAIVASKAKEELIGMSKKDLFLCAGTPMRQDIVDGVEFLTYSSGGDSVGGAVSNGSFVVAKRAHRYCEVTFALQDGKIIKVSYQGRTGGLLTGGEQCAFVVENCHQNKEGEQGRF